ncbi:GMC family oxidoreductase N-terminal domain-containing protein [Microbacteriaceae bacterium K1510]|nr:GMC family oxidoreductase N-terminal domain-containing protein [Microbacteriaceae bacterium K1510]
MASATYDYVIVGAGSAGCTLAARLTEDGSKTVLLLEAGGWDRDIWIKVPLGWGKIFGERRHDWMYFTEREPTLDGRSIECARGKVIGGSSSINAMAYVRGNRADYDRWASYGLPGWSYEKVLPYFVKQETWAGPASPYRGTSGPLKTQYASYADPLVEAYLEAARQAGHGFTADYNGAKQEGFAKLQSTIWRGRRCSAADAYLRPALSRPNLTIETAALATRIVIEHGRAVGIAYWHEGAAKTAYAGREVIVAAGVINTPHLLMLSGIGDPDALAQHDIGTVCALRGVGKNLRDHLSVAVEYSRKENGPFQKAMRLDRIAVEIGKALLLGKGLATDLPSGWTAFVRSAPEVPSPDIQILFRAGPLTAYPYLAPFRSGFADGFATRAVLLRPESTGEIALASADPAVAPKIHQRPYAVESDRKALRRGIRLAHELGRQKALKPFVGGELGIDMATASDADLNAYIRATAQTAHHPLGTCRMGLSADAGAVVDPELKVFGIDNLRVVDASVMPDAISGNINGPVIMIAEAAADLIKRTAVPSAAAA